MGKYDRARRAIDETIIVFPRQQWLRERASVLLYTYIACIVYYYVKMAYIGDHD